MRASGSFGQFPDARRDSKRARRSVETYSVRLPNLKGLAVWTSVMVLMVALCTFTYHAINSLMELKEPTPTMMVPTNIGNPGK